MLIVNKKNYSFIQIFLVACLVSTLSACDANTANKFAQATNSFNNALNADMSNDNLQATTPSTGQQQPIAIAPPVVSNPVPNPVTPPPFAEPAATPPTFANEPPPFVTPAASEAAPFVRPQNGAGTMGPEIASRGGEQDYIDQCLACHGDKGQGVDGLGPDIGPRLCELTSCFNVTVLTNYIRQTMPRSSPSSCGATCAPAVAEYISKTFGSNLPDYVPPPAFVVQRPDLQTPAAQRDFYQRHCGTACHGANGQGGSGGPIRPGTCSGDCSSLDAMYNKVAVSMPPSGSNFPPCSRECAMGTAQLIVGSFATRSLPVELNLDRIFGDFIENSTIEVIDQSTGHKTIVK